MADNEFQTQEQVRPVSQPQVSSAVTSLAYSGSILGDIGARMAQAGSQALAEQMGYQYGKNPQGNLGVPLTKFDQTMMRAYKAQSSAVLSNRANELLLKGQMELAKQDKLTPEYLQAYHNKMRRGLEGISSMAPTGVREQLENKFASSLMTSNANLQIKLTNQQKQDEKNNYMLYMNNIGKNLFNKSYMGFANESQKELEEFYQNNRDKVEARQLTPLQAEQANNSAKLAHFSGLYSNLAIEAMQNGKLTEFMNDFVKSGDVNLNPSEFNEVLSNVTNYVSGQQRQVKNFENIQIGRANLDIERGVMSPEKMADLKNNLSEEGYLSVQAKYFKGLQKTQANTVLLEEGAANYKNPTYMANLTPKERNKIYEYKAQKIQDAYKTEYNENISSDEAKALAVQQSPVPIKAFNDEIDALANSVATIDRAVQMYDQVAESGQSDKLVGVSNNAKNMMELYKHYSQGFDPQTAFQKAHDVVYNMDESRRELIRANYNSWHQKHLSTQAQIDSFVNDLTDMPMFNKPEILDKSHFQAEIIKRFKAHVMDLDGNIELAKKRVQSELSATSGISYVNGKKQYMMGAPEIFTGKSDIAPFVKYDYAQQLQEQLKPYKKAYDKGDLGINDYYEVVMPVSAREAVEAKTQIAVFENDPNRPKPQSLDEMLLTEMSGAENDINKYRDVVRKFESNEPIKVIRHFRDGSKKEYTLAIEPNRYMTETNNPLMRTRGSYIYRLVNEDGQYEHSFLPAMAMNTYYGYRIRQNLINAQYDAYNNIMTKHEDIFERIQNLQKREESKAELVPRFAYGRMGI